jgi:hypothetical protein
MAVFDIETDGLFPTKIHCLSFYDETGPKTLTDYASMKDWLSKQSTLIGHNIVSYDIPSLERLLGVKIKARLIDTLYLSWYLYPERPFHGLESWGETFHIPKPKIVNWQDLPLEDYIFRCEEDVKINNQLWKKQVALLSRIYETNDAQDLPIIDYLTFKAKCAREQEEQGWKLDVDWCQEAYKRLEDELVPKLASLKSAMPNVEKYKVKEKPAKPFKKDGTLSVEGAKWQNYLSEQGLTKDHSAPIYVLDTIEEPNPSSPVQIKNWLFKLGWVPQTFKYEKEDDGSERKIPQVKIPNSPDICPSVLALADTTPEILELQGVSVIQHRLGILKGFLTNANNGYVKARVHGLTNTLRFKHTEIVNLPGVDKPYGLEIRGCLVADEGTVLVGTDMVSLEDTTKKHYIYFHDPDYVRDMEDPFYDPHLDLAVIHKKITKDQMIAHKKGEADFGKIRKPYKVVNYSALYGVGKAKLARELKTSVSDAALLLDVYWKRNWAVKKIVEEATVKTVEGQMWLFNPVSKFWYSLRYMKDVFSTLNQGTGVYCFDSWVRECRRLGLKLIASFHDEIILRVSENKVEDVKIKQEQAIDTVNKKLKLNVTLKIDSHTGHRYSEIHG